MLLINNEIDLGKSFEKLKIQLDITTGHSENANPETKAFLLGLLQGAVKLHIAECTAEADDLKNVL